MSLRLRFLPVLVFVVVGVAGCTTSPAPEKTAAAPAAAATDGRANAFVLLSGGGTPLSNNYSQYLQARALAHLFETRYAAHPSWVFFGIGNREGEAPVLADAYKQVKRDGRLIDTWLPGTLKRNRPASREVFLRALREEILPTVRNGGTLYLFVGDHGTISRGDAPESEITMWELKRDPKRSDSWFTDNKEVLNVTELRSVLADGIGDGRVVFVMTQCHSGGFHYLGVPREVLPPTTWFSAAPDWARPVSRPPPLRAAGFTATDEQSLAAGCDPDPDPDSWAGYERFLPEALLGLDLFTLQPKGASRASFATAHVAATLVDETIDKPRSSSEQYLERWATLIEKLGREPNLAPEVAAAVAAYRRAVDGAKIATADPALRAQEAQFATYIARLRQQLPPTDRILIAAGNRERLEAAIGPANARPGGPGGGGRGGRGGGNDAPRTAWKEIVRPAWKAAVQAGPVPGLAPAAVAFERRLLELEDQGREFMFARGWQNPMLNETYWRSGYAYPAKLDVAKAEAVSRWAAERREKITAWARASADEGVRKGIEIMFPNRARSGGAAASSARPAAAPVEAARPLSRRTAAERVLFYRRTLAAWEFLVTLQHREALDELHALIDLERTPLP